jgi:hypothetical protein
MQHKQYSVQTQRNHTFVHTNYNLSSYSGQFIFCSKAVEHMHYFRLFNTENHQVFHLNAQNKNPQFFEHG